MEAGCCRLYSSFPCSVLPPKNNPGLFTVSIAKNPSLGSARVVFRCKWRPRGGSEGDSNAKSFRAERSKFSDQWVDEDDGDFGFRRRAKRRKKRWSDRNTWRIDERYPLPSTIAFSSNSPNTKNPNKLHSRQVFQCKSLGNRVVKPRSLISLRCLTYNANDRTKSRYPVSYFEGDSRCSYLCRSLWTKHRRSLSSRYRSVLVSCLHLQKLGLGDVDHQKLIRLNWKKKLKHHFSARFVRFVVGVVMVMSVSVANRTPSLALTEENLLFLEAWRTIDRAYVDKSFNGQSWFRYREDALRNEPMNTREETYMAIRKMLATLDDPFTRFLEPEKFNSLRSGTQGVLTGVGLSIGYPTGFNGSSTGLVVISSTPGAPADRSGIVSGDVILAIDGTSTEAMGIYDAAERLQGPEGSSVELTIRSGPEIKQMVLKRERVSLNPVKSRLCEVTAVGKDTSRIGYIKLTSFSQNSSSAVKEAIETLRSNNVNAFVLDLRDNSGGLFPEGIEIAKIWLDKGVIVYICDSRGVRDIYEADGNNAIAASEPLVVLVNKGTASASEILAGALKDNKRAVLFGEPTYGKGKIQSVFELSDGSGMAVTVARYQTPTHIDIDKVGVIPDHPLPTSFPKDVDGICTCLKDSSTCNLNKFELFAR